LNRVSATSRLLVKEKPMSGRRYLIFSDLHLCDIEDHADGWKRYKSSRYVFDPQFSEIVDDFVQDGDGYELTLILNGDILDFDLITSVPDPAPFSVTRRERKNGLFATEEKSIYRLEQILDAHPVFVDTLTRFVGRGHRLVYVMGNHDMDVFFSGVQQRFVGFMRSRADELEVEIDAAKIIFESWFYYVPGEIYVEHGQQYDYYSSFRFVLRPIVTIDGEERLAIPMGNLANRQLMSQMGYFNPHAGDFLMNFVSYMMHWLKFYAFSRRSLLFNWFFGSLYVLLHLLRTKEKYRRPANYDDLLAEKARTYGLTLDQVRSIERLQRPPITDFVFRILREFWLDRMLVAGLMVVGTIALALLSIPLWIKLMVPLTAFPLMFVLYESIASGSTVSGEAKALPRYAHELAKWLPVQVVAFGHTHTPQLVPLARNLSFVNSGTWAPMWARGGEELLPGFRNYIVVTAPDEGRVIAQLDSWQTPAGHPLPLERPQNPLRARSTAHDAHRLPTPTEDAPGHHDPVQYDVERPAQPGPVHAAATNHGEVVR
ncbi:MAG: metallophosphoesterase, partial [Myxococcales bacterium]|nr:metallophosphoesterase [Myxococcales bacterium]